MKMILSLSLTFFAVNKTFCNNCIANLYSDDLIFNSAKLFEANISSLGSLPILAFRMASSK